MKDKNFEKIRILRKRLQGKDDAIEFWKRIAVEEADAKEFFKELYEKSIKKA